MTEQILPRQPSVATPPRLYTVVEVSKLYGVPISTLYDEMDAGRLKYMLPLGRSRGRRLRLEWVEEWIDGGTR